jgi:hypothetical protein
VPDRKVSYPPLAQLELGVGLARLYKVSPGRISLQLSLVVCNFSGSDVGYDLKIRPTGEPTANKHFLRGSNTAGEGKLAAGNTEIWSLSFRAGDTFEIEAAADTANSVSMTLSPAEAHMSNE